MQCAPSPAVYSRCTPAPPSDVASPTPSSARPRPPAPALLAGHSLGLNVSESVSKDLSNYWILLTFLYKGIWYCHKLADSPKQLWGPGRNIGQDRICPRECSCPRSNIRRCSLDWPPRFPPGRAPVVLVRWICSWRLHKLAQCSTR